MKATTWEDPGLVFPNDRGGIRRRESALALAKAAACGG